MLNINSYSPKNKFRAQRFEIFREIIDDIIHQKNFCRILDIGGLTVFWDTFGRGLDWDKLEVYTLNLFTDISNNPKIKSLVGDARDLSPLDGFGFDVVHSNSVIEHVGRWDDMWRMAEEVRRIAPRYFIQTPYFWFPMDPHTMVPFFHWLPEPLRCRIVMKRKCATWQKARDIAAATKAVESFVLLDKHQMGFLFPDAKLISERAFGVTKSLIAVR